MNWIRYPGVRVREYRNATAGPRFGVPDAMLMSLSVKLAMAAVRPVPRATMWMNYNPGKGGLEWKID